MSARIAIDREQLAIFRRRHYIRRLALFGSVLRSDFGPGSDVDVLVEFEPGCVPGFLRLGQIERELAPLMGVRTLDLVTARALNDRIRGAGALDGRGSVCCLRTSSTSGHMLDTARKGVR